MLWRPGRRHKGFRFFSGRFPEGGLVLGGLGLLLFGLLQVLPGLSSDGNTFSAP